MGWAARRRLPELHEEARARVAARELQSGEAVSRRGARGRETTPPATLPARQRPITSSRPGVKENPFAAPGSASIACMSTVVPQSVSSSGIVPVNESLP